ncbi:head-tail adaptor protein [Pedomonas mirosovicensis]|uniref:head-tail adaptor protein n=1 Tax=Pedomonas mirosovicensis TaxID=2908641 RepID=UPI00216882AF|nr:head-tail adaptor protein [Pedomonas mirosovicensis]MCH8684856.1 head-tail adaptor protein [Pedomonas mirosovicensis]
MSETELLGRMRERVAFEAFTGLDDGLGGLTRGWRRMGCGWAAIEMVAVREGERTQQKIRPVRYRLVARKPDGLTPAWRLRWRNRLLGIRRVEDIEGRPELVLLQAEEEALP